jgi:hypothetical protein
MVVLGFLLAILPSDAAVNSFRCEFAASDTEDFATPMFLY